MSVPRTAHDEAREKGGLSEDAIYEKILAAIFDHRLTPGTKLGEDRLASIFGVSRARIRRVLPRLAHEGVVSLEPNRGAFVAKPTVAEARDVFQARRLIEPGIVEQLMRQPGLAATLPRLRRHVAAEAKARAAGDTRSIVRLSGEFHMLLAEAAGNAVLAKTMRELTSLTCLVIALYDRPSVPSCLGEEHGEIVDAIGSDDAGRARELMIHHLNHVERNLDLTVIDARPVELEAVLS
ncbi:MAG: GntR family transcriptional regulator [Betaproteobacteria bacterium]